MIFRILGSILLGGGALGAYGGWALVHFLEKKRLATLARVQRQLDRDKEWQEMELRRAKANAELARARQAALEEAKRRLEQGLPQPPSGHPPNLTQEQMRQLLEEIRRRGSL